MVFIKLISSVVAVVVLAVSSSGQIGKSGILTHVTQKGLRYIGDYSRDVLIDFLKSGHKFTFKLGPTSDLNLEINELQIYDFNKNFRSVILPEPGIGLNWRLAPLTLKAQTNYSISLAWLEKKGRLNLEIHRMSMVLLLSAEYIRGEVKLRIEDCQPNIGIVSLDLPRDILDQVLKSLTRHNLNLLMQEFLELNMCREINNILLPKLSKRFLNLPNVLYLERNLYLRTAITESPEAFADGIATGHSGAIYSAQKTLNTGWKNESFVPFRPTPIIRPMGANQHMVYVYLSNYTLSSLMYWLNKQGRFRYNFNKDSTSASFSPYLRTSCPANEICASTLYPELGKNFPNSTMEVLVNSLANPMVQIADNRIKSFAHNQMEGWVVLPDNSKEKIFSCKIDLNTYISKVEINELEVNPVLEVDTFKLYDVNTRISGVEVSTLEFLVSLAMDDTVAPDLRKSLKPGFKLPKLFDFTANELNIKFEPALITVGVNFCLSNQSDCTPFVGMIDLEPKEVISSGEVITDYYYP